GSRNPSLVVAGRLGPAALRQGRAGRALGGRRAGHVGPVRLLPGPGLVRLLGWRRVHGVMHPAVPRRADLRGLGVVAIDHPAALEEKRRIDLAALGAVVAIAELVLADELAIERGPRLRAEGLAIPPGEEAQEERLNFHRCGAGWRAGGSCQFGRGVSSRGASTQLREADHYTNGPNVTHGNIDPTSKRCSVGADRR